MIVDSHCHLDFDRLREDLPGVLSRAKAADVGLMVTISTRMSTFERVRAIAEAHERIYCSVGVHPHEAAGEGDVTPERLCELAEHPKVVGIGETGLDYYYEHSPREAQAASFRRHTEAARRSGLPLIVHTRAADEDTAEILREEMDRGPFTGVMHCFSAGPDLARAAVELGFYISFSGILTFPKAEELRQIAAEVPEDRLLVETDSPYLAPVPKRGKPNEPAWVVHTAARLAEVRGLPEPDLHRLTTANFFRLFPKVSRPPETAV
ncbi:MAG: TatD family hydrolase [bacterium]